MCKLSEVNSLHLSIDQLFKETILEWNEHCENCRNVELFKYVSMKLFLFLIKDLQWPGAGQWSQSRFYIYCSDFWVVFFFFSVVAAQHTDIEQYPWLYGQQSAGWQGWNSCHRSSGDRVWSCPCLGSGANHLSVSWRCQDLSLPSLDSRHTEAESSCQQEEVIKRPRALDGKIDPSVWISMISGRHRGLNSLNLPWPLMHLITTYTPQSSCKK